MKYLSLICVLVFFSCHENKKVKSEIIPENKLEIFTDEVPLNIDTLKLSLDKDLVENDLVLIQLLEKKYTKDSILNANYRFDFYKNDSFVKQVHFTLKNMFEENGEWYAKSGFKYEETPKYSSFLTISNGYPACGYAHKHLLFDIKNNAFNLIYDYETMFDGGWGSNVEFFEIDDNFIISRKTNFWPNEESTSNEEIGTEELSDSIHFKLVNNKWVKTYVTPKDKIYRSRKISFNKFHNIQE